MNVSQPFSMSKFATIMVALEEAIEKVMNEARVLPMEEISLTEAQGLVLAEDVFSDLDMPPFRKAAVDGFACRREDLDKPLKVIETIAAGELPQKSIGVQECTRIMTGAMVPEGADCVVMIEHTIGEDEGTIRFIGDKTSDNIAQKGEDIRKGEKVLSAGTILEAQHIAVLASVGRFTPKVYRRPLVGIIATGNELVEPWEQPKAGQIRNSNAWQTITQVKKTGAEYIYDGIVKDNPQALSEKINLFRQKVDVLLFSGGISMGEYDYVPQVMKDAGLSLIFKDIDIQPGRPTLFGILDHIAVFGLPGNPVSSFVQFELMVHPFIYTSMGKTFHAHIRHLPIGEDFYRTKANRRSLIPVRIENDWIFPVKYHGSAHINAYTFASGWIDIPKGKKELKKGEMIDVRLL